MQVTTTSRLSTLADAVSALPRPCVLLTVGVPGSGKSTVVREFAAASPAAVVSPDEIRRELTGDATRQDCNDAVWDLAHLRVATALRRGGVVVVDATHTTSAQRVLDTIEYRMMGAAAVAAVVISTPLEVAWERNANRDRAVPREVLERMHAQLECTPPRREEGLSAVWTIQW